ncbi:MAG: hypothetical protein WBP49_02160 [Acidimicrobiia bacterium]
MRGKLKSVAVLTVVVAACSSGGTPATTPKSVTTTTTSTTVPASASTTTTEATTTTLDRLAEIQAIFQDLEERRLQALYDGDREAFRALFANDEYMERSMGAFDVVEFEGAPQVQVEVLDVLTDSASCIAVARVLHRTDLNETSDKVVGVIELHRDVWGFSFTGEGWACDGPHPLSS